MIRINNDESIDVLGLKPCPECVDTSVCFDVRSLGEKRYSVVRGVRVEDKIETSSGMRSKSNK